MNQNPTGETESEARGEDKNNIEKLIEEINKIRKEVKLLEDKGTTNNFNRSTFNNEVYSKLEKLLNLLYDMVTEKMPQKYSLAEIGQHLNEIQGTNDLGYDRLRILWFVANCYDELLSKQEKIIDIRSIANKQTGTPQVTKYKGNKMLTQDAIQSKKVYGFNLNQKEGLNKALADRSKSPIGFGIKTPTNRSRTPIKNVLNKSTTNKTPSKNTGTASKLNISQQQATARKYPMTAKK